MAPVLKRRDDRLDRLHVVDRQRMAMVRLEVHQAAQRAQALGLVVDELRVFLERRVAAASVAYWSWAIESGLKR
jgi:hypothetical protein